ncbi:MAG: hypothetical protein ACYTF0_04355 [Planctomycetota bacterium]
MVVAGALVSPSLAAVEAPLVAAARASLEAGDGEQAWALLHDDPLRLTTARGLWVDVLLDLGRWSEAATALGGEEPVASWPGHERAWRWHQLAQCRLALGEAEAAVAAAAAALAGDVGALAIDRCLWTLAQACVAAGRVQPARQAAERLWTGWPRSPLRLRAGVLCARLLAEEDPRRARQVLTEVLVRADGADRLQAGEALCLLLLAAGRQADARRWFADLSAEAPAEWRERLAALIAAVDQVALTRTAPATVVERLLAGEVVPLAAASSVVEVIVRGGLDGALAAEALERLDDFVPDREELALVRNSHPQLLARGLYALAHGAQHSGRSALAAAALAELRASADSGVEVGYAWMALATASEHEVARAAWARAAAALPVDHPQHALAARSAARPLLAEVPPGVRLTGPAADAQAAALAEACAILATAAWAGEDERHHACRYLLAQAFAQRGMADEALHALASLPLAGPQRRLAAERFRARIEADR